MGLFSWQLLAIGGCVMGSASMPTGNQAVLSVLDEAHALERPKFGVGFDLTASYGQELRSLVEELPKLTFMQNSSGELFKWNNRDSRQGHSRRRLQ